MDRTLRQIFGANVRRLHEQSDLNKVDFCLLTRISRPLLDQIEAGRANVTLDTLERIARSLNVEPSDLLK